MRSDVLAPTQEIPDGTDVTYDIQPTTLSKNNLLISFLFFPHCLQFFKEATETYGKLQKQTEHIRNKFTCNKQTPLETLQDLLRDLEVMKNVESGFASHRRQVVCCKHASLN